MENMLKSIRQEDIQDIFECLSQAVGEDRQEASEHLGLRTRVSEPFLKWDLIYRNLMNKFDEGNLKYSVTKRGMWTVLLLYDENSKLLFSLQGYKESEKCKSSTIRASFNQFECRIASTRKANSLVCRGTKVHTNRTRKNS